MNTLLHTVELKGLDEGWKGHVKLEAPVHTERLKVLSEAGFHRFKEPGKSKKEQASAMFDEQLPALISVYEKAARACIKEVVILGPNNETIDSVSLFDRHPATSQCFAEVVMAYLEGFGPRKKTKQS